MKRTWKNTFSINTRVKYHCIFLIFHLFFHVLFFSFINACIFPNSKQGGFSTFYKEKFSVQPPFPPPLLFPNLLLLVSSNFEFSFLFSMLTHDDGLKKNPKYIYIEIKTQKHIFDLFFVKPTLKFLLTFIIYQSI